MREFLVGGEVAMRGLKGLLIVAAVLISFAVFAGGCAKKQVQTDEEMTEAAAAPTQPREITPEEMEREAGIGAEEPLSSEPRYGETVTPTISEARTHAPMLPIYFDFDKSNVREDQQERMKGNGAFLNENSGMRIRIEGNCDERGTSEYNLALGERRAMSAKKYLMNMGIAENRLVTISYGEEKPLVRGHDELSWAQNRRDDFVVIQ